jgi:hypothetical protein
MNELIFAVTLVGILGGCIAWRFIRNGRHLALWGTRWAIGNVTLVLVCLVVNDVLSTVVWVMPVDLRRLMNRGILAVALWGFVIHVVRWYRRSLR